MKLDIPSHLSNGVLHPYHGKSADIFFKIHKNKL